jgi:allantoate deiminase
MILGSRLLERLDALAACSESPALLQRTFLTSAYRQAAALVTDWMQQAGMATHMDAIGNIIGRYESDPPGAPALLLGSHLDTVRNAGKYDGMLGIVAAIACVAELHATARRLNFAIEVVAFSEEEGVRFGTTLLGSRALTGIFKDSDLHRTDADGITLADAIRSFGLKPSEIPQAGRSPADTLAYIELHIEQGPVLDAANIPVGVVTAISGAARFAVTVTGIAGHAGTMPMHARHDALAAAAACITAIEQRAAAEPGLVATVGCLTVNNAAINTIPGHVRFTIDIRAPTDTQRASYEAAILPTLQSIAATRHVTIATEKIYDMLAAPCAPHLVSQIAAAIAAHGIEPIHLPSGAGHDGLAMHLITHIGMMFVRCAGGISHNPAESITGEDAELATKILATFIDRFQPA